MSIVITLSQRRFSLIATPSTDVLGASRIDGRLAMVRVERDGLMIYEHRAPEGRFYIEWNEPRAWGYSQETKWVGTHKGAVIALGSAPEVVLDAMLQVINRPRGDGSAALTARLPSTLAEWHASRD